MESELEQSSSSDVTHDGQVGPMDLGLSAVENGEGEGSQEAWLENKGDGEWEGVIKLVQELTSRFTSSEQFAGTENVEQKGEQKSNPDASTQTPA